VKTAIVLARALIFVWIVVSGLAVGVRSASGDRSHRVMWMQWMSRRFLRLLGCRVKVTGEVPRTGLVVANHLGYVDILVLGSVCPCVFVAKSEVERWPVFGLLARMAGTVFVKRKVPMDSRRQVGTLADVIREGHPLVLFPEGTSSGGSEVLPFRSSLFEAATASGCMTVPAALHYQVPAPALVERDIAFWADMKLPQHLWNLLGIGSFEAVVAFGTPRVPEPNRKVECQSLHREVKALLVSMRD
jgi:1-acyl-sn-glycerol-3-phosphate acyltransferase